MFPDNKYEIKKKKKLNSKIPWIREYKNVLINYYFILFQMNTIENYGSYLINNYLLKLLFNF